MVDLTDLSDGRPPICYVCEQPLPPDFKLTESGRGHCPGCKPVQKIEDLSRDRETLGEFAERKARSATVGRGQYSLSG